MMLLAHGYVLAKFEALQRRFQGVSLECRRDEVDWDGPWRARLHVSKNERSDYRITAYAETPQEAMAKMLNEVALVDLLGKHHPQAAPVDRPKRKVNLNDRVTVQLSTWGKKILNDHLVMAGLPARKHPDEYSTQLWCLMRDFGSVLHLGETIPFSSTDIIIEKEGTTTTTTTGS